MRDIFRFSLDGSACQAHAPYNVIQPASSPSDALYVLSGNKATDRRDSCGLDAVRCARDPNKNPLRGNPQYNKWIGMRMLAVVSLEIPIKLNKDCFHSNLKARNSGLSQLLSSRIIACSMQAMEPLTFCRLQSEHGSSRLAQGIAPRCCKECRASAHL